MNKYSSIVTIYRKLRNITLLISLILLTTIEFAFAQNKKKVSTTQNPNQIHFQVGVNVVNLFMDRLLGEDVIKYSSTHKSPVAIKYERMITPYFSMGLSYARQSFTINFEEYIDENNLLNIGEFSATVNRNQFYLEPSLIIPMNKLSIYTSLRFGIVKFNADVDADKLELKFIDKFANALLPSAGWTAIGVNYYPLKNLGFNAHVNLGAPDIVGGGIIIRL